MLVAWVVRRAYFLSLCLGITTAFAEGPTIPMGVSRIPLSSLSEDDKARLDLGAVYLQTIWAWVHYGDTSRYQVPEAVEAQLSVEFNRRRRSLAVVELRHSKKGSKSEPRRLVVMVSGLFASEWQDLRRAEWFYDLGYDVLKVPTAFSGSFLSAFPDVVPGDLDTEAKILAQTIAAYRAKYGIEVQGHHVTLHGTSYGASVVLKAAEIFNRSPQEDFQKVIALSPIYDFSYAMQIFDEVMAAGDSKAGMNFDPNYATQFLLSADPQTMAKKEGFEDFAKVELAKTMLQKMRGYCLIKYENNNDAAKKKCREINTFSALLAHMQIKPLASKLTSREDKRVFVLTTLTDPFNAPSEAGPLHTESKRNWLLAIGHTLVLERGGHIGFFGCEVEQGFIKRALSAP